MAVAIVTLPLCGIGEDLISLGGFLELLFRPPITGIPVRVVLQRLTPRSGWCFSASRR